MKFIDQATIEVVAGDGGPGASHFRREKYVPLGGPDGGDGGDGGSVILVADRNTQTLLDFKYRPLWKAGSGNPGEGRLKDGKNGENLEIKVPVGTEVYAEDSRELIVDLDHDGQRHTLARGGRGGKGNNFFKSATNRAPEKSQPGEPGESGTFLLSLKLMADVGLIGLPNAGKSTLISCLSAAKPKIADYPFTTLVPNLGVVQAGERSFVIADIPGLVPGAHTGKGLGLTFLKHVERTRVLVHLVDPFTLQEDGTPLDPLEAFELIEAELRLFSEELAQRPRLVLITKIDARPDQESILQLQRTFTDRGYRCMAISSVSGQHLSELRHTLANLIDQADGDSPGKNLT